MCFKGHHQDKWKEPIEREDINVNHMFEKGLIFRIQKERLQFNKRQIKGKGSE